MTSLAGIQYILIPLFFAASAIFLLALPFALIYAITYILRAIGANYKQSITYAIPPVLCIIAWPLSGLFDLHVNCTNTPISKLSPEKTGPIKSLLLNGWEMRWLDQEINTERSSLGKKSVSRKETYYRRKAGIKKPEKIITEEDIKSKYEVIIEPPNSSGFFKRYLTHSYIIIKERSTNTHIAQIQEPVWGGGSAGLYVAIFSKFNPFYNQKNHYLSCGYAGTKVGIYRSNKKERYNLYKIADKNLLNEVFIFDN